LARWTRFGLDTSRHTLYVAPVTLTNIVEEMCSFARTKYRTATHLYILPSALMELRDSEIRLIGDEIYGMKIVQVDEMPENAQGRRFFVA
jgi:hypothetical protein